MKTTLAICCLIVVVADAGGFPYFNRIKDTRNAENTKAASLIGSTCVATKVDNTVLCSSISTPSFTGVNTKESPLVGTLTDIVHAILKEGSSIVQTVQNLKVRQEQQQKSQALEKSKISSIQSVWEYHSNHILEHLQASESILFPKVFSKESSSIATALVQGHGMIRQLIKEVTNQVECLEDLRLDRDSNVVSSNNNGPDQTVLAIQDLSDQICQCEQALAKQLEVDLETMFSQVENNNNTSPSSTSSSSWGSLMRKYMSGGGVDQGSFISAMGEDTFRSEWMTNRGIPSFVWHASFKRSLSKFQYKFIHPLNEILL